MVEVKVKYFGVTPPLWKYFQDDGGVVVCFSEAPGLGTQSKLCVFLCAIVFSLFCFFSVKIGHPGAWVLKF